MTYRKNTAIDRHYHDCDEYWIVLEGNGEVVVDDRHAQRRPRRLPVHRHGPSARLSRSSDGEVKAVFFETTLQGRKRTGHLWNHTHGPAEPVPGRV